MKSGTEEYQARHDHDIREYPNAREEDSRRQVKYQNKKIGYRPGFAIKQKKDDT